MKQVRRCKHCMGSPIQNEIGETIAFCEEWDEWRNVTLGDCFTNCEMEEYSPLTIDQVIEVINNEKKCVAKNILGCDRDCFNCELVMRGEDIIEAYNFVTEMLEKYKREECVDHELHG